MNKNMKIIDWVFRILAAIILLQTLYFKFSAAEESVHIFSTLGMEPWGRIGIGVVELIAAALLLYPKTVIWGAGLSAGTIAGAVFFHLTQLGIEVQGDGGLLFGLALSVLIANLITLILNKDKVAMLLAQLLGRKEVAS